MKSNDYTPRNTHKKVMPNSSQGSQKNTKLILALIKKKTTTQKNKPSKMFAYHIVHTNFFP